MDCHVHSLFSSDSRTTIDQLKAQARPITLTDHYDIHARQGSDFRFDPTAYFEQLLPVRDDNFLIGVEIGLRQEGDREIRSMLEDYPFDFVLGSVHAPFDAPTKHDFYMDQTFLGMDQLAAQTYYFEEVLRSVEFWPEMDALSHLDYVIRSAQAPGRELLIEPCTDLIEAIFIAMVDRQIVLEVNTRRFSQASFLSDWHGLLKLYRQAGGRQVVLGSDAHSAAGIYRHFDQVGQIIRQYGLERVYFDRRVMKQW